MENPYRKKRIKEFLWITAIGFAIAFMLCPSCFLSVRGIISYRENIALSVLYSYVLGYGITYILSKADKKYSWLENPGKKFLLHFVLLALYSFVVSAVVFYLFAYFLFESESWLTVSEAIRQAKLPVFIAIGISAFFTGTDFLKNWKNEAVRAERLKKEKIATQYESLKNRVNPHFLFNSLNALSELVYEDKELAVRYIRKLSAVYRYVLDTRESEIMSLRDELEFLESFIFLQKIRFGDNLITNINIEKNDTEYLLPLSLQIIFENAVKHNVVSVKDPLTISVRRSGDYIVTEHKIKRKKITEPGTGIGLANIKMRYEYLTEKPFIAEEIDDKFVVKLPILSIKP